MLTYLQNETGPKHEKDFQMFKTQKITCREPSFYQKKISINSLHRVAKTKTGTVLHRSERMKAAQFSIKVSLQSYDIFILRAVFFRCLCEDSSNRKPRCNTCGFHLFLLAASTSLLKTTNLSLKLVLLIRVSEARRSTIQPNLPIEIEK